MESVAYIEYYLILLEVKTMKKYIFVTLLLMQVSMLSACGNRKELKNLTLPDRADVISVMISCDEEKETITDSEEIDNIFNVLSSVNRKSKESYNDAPQTEKYLRIDFEIPDGMSSNIVYVFKEEGSFFTEQPYNGIFSIDENQYGTIYDLFNNHK